MGKRSWIHFIYSSEIAYFLEEFIRKNDAIFIVGSVLIDGIIQAYDGQIFGQKGKKFLSLLTQSDGNHVVEEMVKRGLTDFFHTVLLDNLMPGEIESGDHGYKIIKAKYLTEDEYYREVFRLPEYSRNEKGLSVGNLKKILNRFDDSDMVDVWREIFETEYYDYLMGDQTERFDACYEAQGDLTFKLSTSVDNYERLFRQVKVSDVFRKVGIFYRSYKPDEINVFGESDYYKNEYEKIKKGLKNIYDLTRPNEPNLGYLDSNEIYTLSKNIKELLGKRKNDQIVKLLDSISKIISKMYENNSDIINSNYYLKFKTFNVDINSDTPFFITSDEKNLVYGAKDNIIKVMELQTGKIMKTFKGHKSRIGSIISSLDGKYCVSGSEDGVVMLWNYESGELMTEVNDPHQEINNVSIPSNNKYIVSASKSIKIWDFITGDLIHQLNDIDPNFQKKEVRSIKCTQDGKYLISGSGDSTIKTWNIETGELVHTFKEHHRGVSDVSFSPDEKYVISSSWDKTVKVWEFLKGDILKTIVANYFESSPYSSMISPDGNQIISHISFGSINRPSMVKIWDFNTTKLLQTLIWKNGEWGQINSVKISPKGNYIISCSRNEMINICLSLDYYYELINELTN